jgi:hypothetical protein
MNRQRSSRGTKKVVDRRPVAPSGLRHPFAPDFEAFTRSEAPVPLHRLGTPALRWEVIRSTLAVSSEHDGQPSPALPSEGQNLRFDRQILDPQWSDPLYLMMAAEAAHASSNRFQILQKLHSFWMRNSRSILVARIRVSFGSHVEGKSPVDLRCHKPDV